MLLLNNELPLSMYVARKTLNSLGMEYEKIHECPNDSVLYRKELKYASYVLPMELRGGGQIKQGLRGEKEFLRK